MTNLLLNSAGTVNSAKDYLGLILGTLRISVGAVILQPRRKSVPPMLEQIRLCWPALHAMSTFTHPEWHTRRHLPTALRPAEQPICPLSDWEMVGLGELLTVFHGNDGQVACGFRGLMYPPHGLEWFQSKFGVAIFVCERYEYLEPFRVFVPYTCRRW